MNNSPSKKEKLENHALLADIIYRDVMSRSVATIFYDNGYGKMDRQSHDILTEMACNFLNDMCRMAKMLCDHSGRSEVVLRDVQLSLDTMGISIGDFCLMLKNLQTSPGTRVPEPEREKASESPMILKIGEPRPHPPHMLSIFPPFPDPHTYIRTNVSGDVESDYEKVRNISANNKRNVENSLINLALAMYPSISVFQEYENALSIEAKSALEHAKRLKQQKIEERRMAKNTLRLKQDLATGSLNDADILMDDLLQDETNDENIVVDDVQDDSSILSEIEHEELFEHKDTEHSYIKRRIPEFCQILLPFEEETPYLSALVTDENLDDDANHFAKILSKEIEDELAAETDDFENSGLYA